MTADRISVETFADISNRLPSRESGGVARSLNAGAAAVLVVEEWLVADTDLDSIDGERRVFVGECDRETEKAWLFSTGATADWVPKSQSVLFSAATTEPIETPQHHLGEFERTPPSEAEP
jgi:hypothetical protein